MPTNRRRDVLEDKTDMRSKADCGDQTIDERPAATEGNAIKEEEMTDVRPTIDSTEDTIDKGLVAIEGNTIKEEEMTFSKTLDIYYLWELVRCLVNALPDNNTSTISASHTIC